MWGTGVPDMTPGLSILRHVPAGYQDNQTECPAN